MKGAIARAEEMVRTTPGAWMPSQFDNPANPEIHRLTTAKEIWKQTGGNVDLFVAAVGTGGTLTGVAEAIKARKPDFKAIAVEPKDSPVITQLCGGTLNPVPQNPGGGRGVHPRQSAPRHRG